MLLFPLCELGHFLTSDAMKIYRQWVPCERNSSYNFVLIFLKLCTCFLHGLEMCIWFGYNPWINFCQFFHFVNFVIFWPQIVWKFIDSGYLVNATPYTISYLLAHLIRRLTRWAYSIPMVRRPSVVVHHRPHFQTWISLKPVGQSWSNYTCSITGTEEKLQDGGRLDQNCGFHGNRKPLLTYNGENDVSTFSRLFSIRFFLYLQVTRTCIKSWTN